MTIDAARALLKQSDELHAAGHKLRLDAIKMFADHYGLVPGVTRLRSEGREGVFLELLNQFDGPVPWVKVLFDPPLPQRFGKYGHFYQAWEIVPQSEKTGNTDA